jgi:hypothetical protein
MQLVDIVNHNCPARCALIGAPQAVERMCDLTRALFSEGPQFFRPARDLIADIVAAHIVDHLDADGFVMMRKPPITGHALSSWIPPK